MSVTDLTLWKGIWAFPALQEVLKSGMMASQADGGSAPSINRAERRKQAAQAKPTPNPVKAQAEAALTLVGMLPHTIQAVIQQDSGSAVWRSLREDGLIVSASDLTLKHGVTVSGVWTVVGELDALPSSKSGPVLEVDTPMDASPMSGQMRMLTPAIRDCSSVRPKLTE